MSPGRAGPSGVLGRDQSPSQCDGGTFPARRRRRGLEASLQSAHCTAGRKSHIPRRRHPSGTIVAPSGCRGATAGPWGPPKAPGGTDSPVSLLLLTLWHPGALPGPRGSPTAPLPGLGPRLGAAVPKHGAVNAALPSSSLLSQPHRNSAPGPGCPPAPMGAEPAAPHPAPPAQEHRLWLRRVPGAIPSLFPRASLPPGADLAPSHAAAMCSHPGKAQC